MSRLSEDLRQRTKRTASMVISLDVSLPKSRKEVDVLGTQLLRSGTSIAAYAREASRARSDAEFCSKLDGLVQEADESLLWLELLKEDCKVESDLIDMIHSQTSEILAVFTSIVSKVGNSLPR